MKNEKKNESVNLRKKTGPVAWLRRMFFGASKEFADDMEQRRAAASDVEAVVSPGKQIVKNFFERKVAVIAMFFVIAMFLFVLIAPVFMPRYSDAYTEVTQKNVPPGYSMLSVPSKLKNNIKMISSYGSFSVGLSNDGEVFVWGNTQIGTTGLNMKDIPEEVLNDKIAYVAAGYDHAVAISETGKVYAWGHSKLGQYGLFDETEFPSVVSMPEELVNGTVDVANIKKVTAGYQCTAILMNDGSFYIWGNKNAYANIDNFRYYTAPLKDLDFTLNYIVGVPANGKTLYTGVKGLHTKARATLTGEAVSIADFLKGRTIEAITATSNNTCLTLSDGSVCFTGDFSSNVKDVPKLAEGEKFVSVGAGTYHYTGLTNLGNLYSWGNETLGQCDVPKNAKGSSLYVGAFQNYAVDENGDLQSKWGLKGYLFGTDGYGADIFMRIINGGKMTMTIGCVAVIISSIIGIIVGCISGYFGGAVDIVLMRVTEIFSAIPFLPFAMILSSIMGHMPISENGKIFIIMCILGVLSWTGLARLVRGQVLAARESEYVTAAKAMGVKESTIAFKHILPNVVSVILVTLTLDFAGCMLTESSLSYLGFGVTYPRPTWGNMLNGANNATVIKNFWWQWLFTALFLAVTTICINIVGDTLRDVMDPKSSVDR